MSGLSRFPPISDDEGTYVAQAWAARTSGALAHYTYWYDHPPLGWLQLAGLETLARPLTWWLGSSGSAVLDARRVMFVPFIVTCILVYVLARRLGTGRVLAGLAVLAFGLSPLSVSMLRQVYLDGLALPWAVGALVLVFSPKRRLWAFAAAGACLAIAVLSKETMLVLLPAVALALWFRCDRRTRAFCIAAFGVPFVLLLLSYPLLGLLKGELLPGPDHVSLFDAVAFQLGGRESTGSGLVAGTRSREVISSWLAIDSWLIVGGVTSAVATLWSQRLRPIGVGVLSIVIVGLRPGYLPQPYVIALLPLCAVAIAVVAEVIARRCRQRLEARPMRWDRRLVGIAIPALVALLVLSAGIAAIGSNWSSDRESNDAWNANASATRAQQWLTRNLDPRARILVDDTYYVDLVEAGFAPRLGVVWFYKLDSSTNLDPSVSRALPRGYREFDYVVSSPTIRAALAQNPQGLRDVRRAVAAGEPVARFGRAGDTVTVLRLRGEGLGSQALRAAERADGWPRPPMTRGAATATALAVVLAVTGCADGTDRRDSSARESTATDRATAIARGAAEQFLARYVDDAGRVLRRDQGSDIVSEGQSYALVLALAIGDHDTFSKVWQWTREHLERADGLLATQAGADGSVIDRNAATDSDVVVAWALLRDTGPHARVHRDAGRRIATAVLDHTTTVAAEGPVLTAGNWATGEPATLNPSYWTVPMLRDLAELTGDQRWQRLASHGVRLVDDLTGSGRHLPPDWARADRGVVTATPAPNGQAGEVRYSLDAQRVVVWFALAGGRAASLAEAWGGLIDTDRQRRAIALRPDGEILDGRSHPTGLVAAAASAEAGGHRAERDRLLDAAAARDVLAPSYYGSAWVALGRVFLSTDLLPFGESGGDA